MKREKTVTRMINGTLLKGYMKDFSPGLEVLVMEEAGTEDTHHINIDEVKAVFFVKSFEGNNVHREKKILLQHQIKRTEGLH